MDFIRTSLLEDFHLTDPKIALIGLHACGDLTPTALKLALESPQIEQLVIMPCCYHRMTLIREQQFQCFPMSRELQRIIRSLSCSGSLAFHRPFLRLAAQQVAHWNKMRPEEHRLRGRGMFIRSLAGALVAAEGESPP